MEVSVEDLEKA
jgi:alpha-tubulin suppressor-like RCC1 family protein